MRRTVASALLAALLALPAPVRGNQELPASQQALILLRVLGYDRALAQRAGEVLTIAVVWRAGDETQRDEALEALRALAEQYRVAGRRIRAVPVRWEGAPYASRVRDAGAVVVLLSGSLATGDRQLIQDLRSSRVLVAAGTRSAVDEGASLGFIRGPKGVKIFVNLAAARAAGADFDSTLFTVVQVVGE